MSLHDITEKLQSLLGRIQSLPDEKVSLDLPEVYNPGTMVNVQPGYQFIGADGNVVTGDMPIIDFKNIEVVTLANGNLGVVIWGPTAGYYDGLDFGLYLQNVVHKRPDGTEGTINLVDNGKTSGTLDGLNSTSVSVPEGYTEGGEITFDDTALAARIDAI